MLNTGVQQAIGYYNLKLLSEGTYAFYVDVEYYDSDDYIVEKCPAEVRIEENKDREDYGLYEERTIISKYYYVDYVYINGKKCDFTDADPVKIDELNTWYVDDNEVDFTLRNQHAFSNRIDETDYNNIGNYIILGIEIIAMLTCLIALSSKDSSERLDNEG